VVAAAAVGVVFDTVGAVLGGSSALFESLLRFEEPDRTLLALLMKRVRLWRRLAPGFSPWPCGWLSISTEYVVMAIQT
jgi:hypothetical protein